MMRLGERLLAARGARIGWVVLALYGLLGLAVGAGLLGRDEILARFGPGHLRGWGDEPSREERLAHLDFHLGLLSRALQQRDPEGALAEIDLGGLRVAERDEGWTLRLEECHRRLGELSNLTGENIEERLGLLEEEVGQLFGEPERGARLRRRLALLLGTDRQGRSILLRGLYSVKVALQVGAVAAGLSVILGALLGALAAWFGGWVDRAVVWLFSIFSSIPYVVLLLVLASLFVGTSSEGSLVPIYAALCLTFWVVPCRLVRAEVAKLREFEYTKAARSAGLGWPRILLGHVLPNLTHLLLIQATLLFVAAIKAEVVLSFLGLGVRDEASWGIMIQQASGEILQGFYWQIGTATLGMLGLVLAFNLVADALQDALDPEFAG